jgi:CMP-N,N'-diacetyllegionaminic acid synthase
MKPLIIIPARGGSKGIPRKNIRLLNGIPLIHYTIKAAQDVFDDTFICVSTDDEEIRQVAEQTNLAVPFIRPKELASDFSGTYEVLLHAIEYYEKSGYVADTVILLQPTSPFRNSSHIKDALKLYSAEIDMLVSVKETKSNPYYILFEEDESGFLKKCKDGKFRNRQNAPKVWEYNGAIYIINVTSLKSHTIDKFKRVKKFEMDEYSSLDIDTQFDWEMAELIQSKYEN